MPLYRYSPAILFLWLLTASCNTSFTCGSYETPSNVPNPKLASLINDALDAELGRMNPTWSPGLIPEAQAHAREWLREIDHVVTHCKCNPRNDSKMNRLVYDITLRSGKEIKDVYTGSRCYQYAELRGPLVMKIAFKEGKVSEVFTDGSERKESVDFFKGDVSLVAEKVIRADWQRRKELYFPPEKTAEQKAEEWK